MADLASLVVSVDSRDVKRGAADLDGLTRAGGRAEKAVGSMSGEFRKGARDTSMLGDSASRAGLQFGALGAAAATAAALVAGRAFLTAADQMTNLESRINLTLKATENYNDIQRELNNIARGSVASLNDVGTLYARITPAIQKLGGGQRESLAITSALTNALRINGATTAEASSAIIQFSQAMQSGILRGEEFNALNENAGPLLDALAKQLGVTRGELRQMAFDGKLTGDVVANGILPAVAELQATAAKMGPTASAAFQDLGDDVRIAVGEIDKASGATAALSGAVNNASKIVRDFGEAFRTGNFTEQQQTMLGIAGAVTGIAVAYGTARTALGLLTLAQLAFNTAVRANPLIMGLSVVAAGAAAIYGYEKATNAATSTQDKLNKALKQKADIDARLASGSPSVVAAAQAVSASTNARVAALQKQAAAEKNAAELKIINEAAAEVAADKARKSVELTKDGYVKLGGVAGAAGTKATKAMKDAQKAAEQAAKAIQDVLNKQQGDIARSVLGEAGAARMEFANSGASAGQQAAFAQSQEVLAVLDMVDKAWAEIDDKQKAAAESAAKYIDDFLNADFGSNLAAGFDKAGQALATLVAGVQDYIDITAKSDAARASAQSLFEQGKLNEIGLTEQLAKIEKKETTAQLGAYASIAGAAKGLFKEQSAGAKALGKIEQTLRVAQIAHSAWEKKDEAIKLAAKLKGYAIDLGTFLASIPLKIAGFLGIGGAAAAAATAAAAIQPGPAAFVGFAAMAALVASIGFALGGSGGSKGNPSASNAGKGFGTTLGDSKQASESISKSIDDLSQRQDMLLTVNNAMLSVLRSIDNGIQGYAAQLFQFRETTGAKVKGFSVPSVSAADLSAIMPSLVAGFGGTMVQSASGIIGNTSGKVATDFEAAQSFFKFFSMSVQNVGKLFEAGAPVLGKTADQIRAAISAAETGDINIKGLSRLKGQELADRLAAVVGATADRLASQIDVTLGLGLAQFQKVGEGLLETLTRVIGQVEQVTAGFDRIGVSIGGLNRSFADMAMTVENIISGAGGLDRLQAGLDTYFSEFLTPAEQAAKLMQQVGTAFSALGIALPASIDAFRALVAGIDITSEAGQKLYGSVIALAPAFSDAMNAVSDLIQSLESDVKSAEQAVIEAYEREKSEIERVIAAREQAKQAYISAIRSEIGGLDQLISAHETAANALRAAFDREISSLDALIAKREEAADAARSAFDQELTALDEVISKRDAAADAVRSAFDREIEALDEVIAKRNAAVDVVRAAYEREISALDAVISKREDAANAVREAYNREIAILDEVIAKRDSAADALREAYNREADVFKQTISQFDDLAKSLGDFVDELSGRIVSTQVGSYRQLQAQFASIARRAALGDVEALRALPSVGADLAGQVADNSATSIDAARELARIRAQAVDAQGVAIRQKSIAEQQLDVLTQQADILIGIKESVVSFADAALTLQTASAAATQAENQKSILTQQMQNLGLLVDSQQSVAEAVQNLQTATAAAAQAESQKSLLMQQMVSLGVIVESQLSLESAIQQLQTAADAANQAESQKAIMTEQIAALGLIAESQKSLADAAKQFQTASAAADQAEQQKVVLTEQMISLGLISNSQQSISDAVQSLQTANDAAAQAEAQKAVLMQQMNSLGLVAKSQQSIAEAISVFTNAERVALEAQQLRTSLADELAKLEAPVQSFADAAAQFQTADAAATQADAQLIALTKQAEATGLLNQNFQTMASAIANLAGAQAALAAATSEQAALQKAANEAAAASAVELARQKAAADAAAEEAARREQENSALELAVAEIKNIFKNDAIALKNIGDSALALGNALKAKDISSFNVKGSGIDLTKQQIADGLAALTGAASSDLMNFGKSTIINLAKKSGYNERDLADALPKFASGGMHAGGWRLVGENGPELEYTGPSRIFNAGQTSNMLDNSDQVAEMRAMRDEMKGYLWSISKSTLRTADRLDRWDDGDRMNVRIDNEADDPALVRTVA